LPGCTAMEPTLADRSGWPIEREFVQVGGRKVELLWAKPAEQGRRPAVLFIHGHQEINRNGGETYLNNGRLGTMARRGYVAAALSQPGYGKSEGPPDFCGPFTQEAALAALAHLRAKAFVSPDRVAIFGYSRGAIVASMVATRDAQLAGVILGAGAYDFFTWYPTPLRGIDRNISVEAGTSAAAFRARSALHHADRIRAPVLILHGERDERIPVGQAQAFAERLRAAGVPHRLKVFPGAGHGIPVEELYREVYPFLARVLE
jgi:dipeptidyl aminopeptidase/acylaminoacyl peptidase